MRMVLASASPRRAELLRAAGFDVEIVAVDVDEAVRPRETPSAYVRRLAAAKSARAYAIFADLRVRRTADLKVRATNADRTADLKVRATTDMILGADTTVVVDDEILGKPRDDAEAAAMLRRLSGRSHEVLTGVSLRRGGVEIGRVESTAVYFARLSDADIAWYVASGEGRDKAGAYAIQGLASRFIPRIEGSYSNVVGLPVACVHELVLEIVASLGQTGYSDT